MSEPALRSVHTVLRGSSPSMLSPSGAPVKGVSPSIRPLDVLVEQDVGKAALSAHDP